ncbi:ImmA/IrrE family metallo-endopeptidase [Tumidithrix elongata RA019]|uniref:ImmA/IrrE family metallo-endopeptidase n=1 Tax=Tumidithrix elongata BACA0141 TaxID=2716417 RepID=A0AAW9PP68_9CYAN|nr:ImmA/IrrE family metallo-endopeptidase [Tumidithrix elongata RA019]
MTQTQAKPNYIDLKTLYDRLKQLGFNRDFIKDNGLPEWWCDEYEASPDAVVTAAFYFSRRFNLDFNSLLNQDLAPTFETQSKTRFKTVSKVKSNAIQDSQNNSQFTEDTTTVSNKTIPSELVVAHNLALRVAELVSHTYKQQYHPVEGITAREIRAAILDKYANVSLEALLAFCHEHGIPIAHFADFPNTVKKFHGMVTQSKGHPVILASLRDRSPSRLSFIIAHELGHIALGHLKDGMTISEEEIGTFDLQDNEECAANEFAAELILGQPDRVYYFPHFMTADRLAKSAIEKSQRDRVDSGAIVWNYGWYKKSHFPVARKAAGLIEQEANAPQLINKYLSRSLDWESLSNDNQEYLALVLGLDILEIMEEARNCLPAS